MDEQDLKEKDDEKKLLEKRLAQELHLNPATTGAAKRRTSLLDNFTASAKFSEQHRKREFA